MKHNTKITIVLLTMFILAQLIGLYVVNFYINPSNPNIKIPYGFDNQEIQKQQLENPNFYNQFLISFITSFAIALLLVFFLMKIRTTWIMRIWMFAVVSIAMGIVINILTIKLSIPYPAYVALAIGLILSFFKIFKRNVFTHNLTELLIYPGIACIFVVILNLKFTIIVLILISIYDIWAVWHSGFMMKMAKFQINKVGIFGGLLIPYASRKMREKIKLLKLKYKNKITDKIAKKHKLKVRLAVLGGGDIFFPIVASGVFLKTFSSIPASLIVSLFAVLALSYIFVFGKKEKAYPAMPYLTTGIFIGMLVAWFFLRF